MIHSNEQFLNMMNGLRAAYPRFKVADSAEGMRMWEAMLSDIPYEQLSKAVQKHISTSKYPPSIADIRELATHETPSDWGQGWELTLRLIRRHGSYGEQEALEELKQKDIRAYKTVKRMSFKELCFSENITADRANFRMIYEQVKEQDKYNQQLPERLRDRQLDELEQNKWMLPEQEGE